MKVATKAKGTGNRFSNKRAKEERARKSITLPPTVYKLYTYLLTELSPSWEAANCAATQEFPSILRNPKVHHRFHKSPPLVPISVPQAGGPPLFDSPRLLIQYIRSYPPYLEAVSSIRSLRTRHVCKRKNKMYRTRSSVYSLVCCIKA
jgi:hypothetical protein